jgi:hypothetical protein
MGSIRLDGVRFVAYLEDHEPRHVHGFYAETEVIVELHDKPHRNVARAKRSDAVRPGNASRSDVRRVLRVAAAHLDELVQCWEDAHA